MLAREAAEDGRFEEALALAMLLLDADPAHCDGRFICSLSLLMLDRPEEARAILDPFVSEFPGYPDAAWLRAGLLRRMLHETHPDILAAYDLVAAVDADNLYAHVERAEVLRAHGRYDEARGCYSDILRSAACTDMGLRTEAAFNLGCVALVLGDTEAARMGFEQALQADPGHVDAAEMLALLVDTE